MFDLKCMVRRQDYKKNRCDENSLRKCLRRLEENGLRAHDDDADVPVLADRHSLSPN